VEQEVGEERLGTRRVERREGRLAETEVQLAEKPDVESRRFHGHVAPAGVCGGFAAPVN
jgi:hypothetical protein